jgi:hypothetical protein
MLKFIGPLIVLVALAPCGVRAGEIDCGALVNHFGPFDYRTTPKERRSLVEDAHFTPAGGAVDARASTAVIGADINYVLSVFPNHPRALLAMMNLAQKEKAGQAERVRGSVSTAGSISRALPSGRSQCTHAVWHISLAKGRPRTESCS